MGKNELKKIVNFVMTETNQTVNIYFDTPKTFDANNILPLNGITKLFSALRDHLIFFRLRKASHVLVGPKRGVISSITLFEA